MIGLTWVELGEWNSKGDGGANKHTGDDTVEGGRGGRGSARVHHAQLSPSALPARQVNQTRTVVLLERGRCEGSEVWCLCDVHELETLGGGDDLVSLGDPDRLVVLAKAHEAHRVQVEIVA